MKIAFNPLKYRYHVFRPWLVQPIMWSLFFLSPIMNWFRVDMLHQQMIFMGKIYPFEIRYLMWIPIGFYAVVLVVAIFTALMGRIFCGWACPHNILTEWTKPIRAGLGIEKMPRWMKLPMNRRPWLKKAYFWGAVSLAIVVPLALSFLLFNYVMPMDWLVESYLSGRPHPTLLMGQILFTAIGLFSLLAGHLFCRSTCPYGLAQSISAYQTGKWRPMEIHYTGDMAKDCGTCTACQQVCLVEIDPRKELKVGSFEGCWNCGECIDACKQVHEYRGKPGLLTFGWPWVPPPGSPKAKKAKSY